MINDNCQARGGFTLTELIVVLAVVALAGGVVTSTLATTRVRAQSATCLGNFQSLGAAWMLYAEGHNGNLTGAFDWVQGRLDYAADNPDNTNRNHLLNSRLSSLVRDPIAFKCPADRSTAKAGGLELPRVRSVAMNQMFRPASEREGWTSSPPWRNYVNSSDLVFPAPANLWVLVDENPDSVNDAAFAVVMDRQKWGACWQDGPSILHNGGGTLSFADGHAELRRWKDPQTLTMKVTYRVEFPYGRVQPYNLDVQWMQDRTTAWE